MFRGMLLTARAAALDAHGPAAFGDYLEHARRQRQAEEDAHAARGGTPRVVAPLDEKTAGIEATLTPEEQERVNARRALRSASVRGFLAPSHGGR
jgi:hypothetical protein